MSYADLEAIGLIDIETLNGQIIIDLPYATINNFVSTQMYPQNRAFIRQELGPKLIKIQEFLLTKKRRLKILDAYRPFSIQEKLFELCPNEQYLAKPIRKGSELVSGSKHSRGVAIDATLCLMDGSELEMPSLFDEFSRRAHRVYEGLSPLVLENVLLLERAFEINDFKGLPHEWWHFDLIGWEKFPLIDVPLSE